HDHPHPDLLPLSPTRRSSDLAGGSGNVVDAVTAESHDINHALGWNAEDFFHFRGVTDQIVFRRIQDADPFIHQLHHVLIAGDHVDKVRSSCGLAGQSSDHVVGFETRKLENWYAIQIGRAHV